MKDVLIKIKFITEYFIIICLLTLSGTRAQGQIISTIAGTGTPGYTGNGGQAIAAELHQVAKTCLDDSGNLYIADAFNNVIRKVSVLTGIITTVAGNGSGGSSGDGGLATAAELNYPNGVAVDDSDNIYIADYGNQAIRKVSAKTGFLNTVAGTLASAGSGGDGGAATSAQLSYPTAVALDDSDNIYICDQHNNRIRKVTKASGIIITVVGNGSNGNSGNGGQAINAELNDPSDLVLDDSDNIYIADGSNNQVRKVSKKTGIIVDYAGSESNIGGYSGDYGAATAAELNTANGIGIDDSDNIYIADQNNQVIRKVFTNTGIIITVAGNNALGAGYIGDGGPATNAQLNVPNGVSVDKCGNFYIADDFNNVVRKVTVSSTSPLTASETSPSICSGGADTLTVRGGSNYIWSPATGLNTTAGSMVIATPAVNTTYMVNGTSTCVGAAIPDTIVVMVSAAPSFTIIQQPPQSTCDGQPVTLSVNSGGSNFTWSPSTGLSATTGDTVIAIPTDTTIYMVTGTNSGGCSTTGSDTINIISAPPLTILPQPGPLFCSGLSAELKVQGGGSNFTWTPTTGLSDTTSGDSVLASPLTTTTYIVTGNDSAGCASSGVEIVTVIASPNKPTFYQHGDTLTSSATTDNQWYMDGQPLNDDTSQNLIIYNTSPDSFYVVVENEANGCSTSSDTEATTGINQLSLISNQLSIYPNPFNNEIVINISSSAQDVKDWTLQVIDVLGRTVYSLQSLNYNNDIDLSNLTSGIYFITVSNKTGRAILPLIKQN